MKILRVCEAFSGVGSQRMSLRNLGVRHKVVCTIEIDKYAIASYEAIHGPTVNLGDISKVNTEDIPDHDLFTYSFPCQDISVAGLQRGLDMGSGTRSGLLWECQKVISVKRPKFLLLENVKNLVGKKHKHNFDKWLEWLTEQGYTNYWKILNAKDYGVPQNRERVFVVSILGEHTPYKFPEPIELTTRLKDILENEVDEKYYLSDEQVKRILTSTYVQSTRRIQEKDWSDTLCARDYKDPKCVEVQQIGQYNTPTRENSSRFRVYSPSGIAPSLTTMGGGNLEPHIPVKNATKQGYLEAREYDGVDLAYPESEARRGRVQKQISNTLTSSDNLEVVIGAMRGRNPENPTSREVGLPTEQMLEINKKGTSNCITTVQKDNLVICEQRSDEGLRFFKGGVCGSLRTIDSCGDKRVIEPKPKFEVLASTTRIIEEDPLDMEGWHRRAKQVVSSEGISPCVAAQSNNLLSKVKEPVTLRIRKLTPRECWRLMGFSDEDFDKAQKVVSNSQLYKQAGNSIVVNVLEAIFKNLLSDYMVKTRTFVTNQGIFTYQCQTAEEGEDLLQLIYGYTGVCCID